MIGCRGAASRAHGPAAGPCDSSLGSLEALKQQWQVRHCFRSGDANQHETSCVRDPNRHSSASAVALSGERSGIEAEHWPYSSRPVESNGVSCAFLLVRFPPFRHS
ncbi:hypothetical protein PG991_002295 [Apiospora marii]|uniref:Uncharacterized protein n=1 Tax=Apiospora marii TaxID=335849 RepID=A0ABR1SEZ9_9PEZI